MSLTVSPERIVEESKSPLLRAPEGWPRRPLGEVATILNGFAFKSKQFVSSGGIPLIRIRDIFKTETAVGYVGDYDDRYLVRPGELLVGMDGDFNCTRWEGPEGLLNQRVCKVTPDPKVLELEYLTIVLPGYLQAIHDLTSSTTVTHLSSRDIAQIPFPVPSLSEQKELAGVINDAAEKRSSSITHIVAARKAIDRFRQAILAAACSGRLTADWRQDRPEPAKWTRKSGQLPKIDTLVDTPEEWHWAYLEEIALIKGGIQKGAKLKSGDPTRKVPYLRVANVQRGWLDLTEIKTIDVPESRVAELRLEPGDVLFNEGGDRDKLGRGWVWEGQIEECVHQNHVFRARLRDASMQPRFYSWYGNTVGASYFIDQGKQTVNLASLSMSTLKSLPVPVPSPAEQTEIVHRVDQLMEVSERILQSVDSAEKRVERTSQAILAKAFRGELAASERGAGELD